MTMRGTAKTPLANRRICAALVQLHHATHPERIGRQFGFTGQYVRKLWREMHPDDLPPAQVALNALTQPYTDLPQETVNG